MNNINKLRKKKSLTYQAIAERAGITTQYVSQLANGEKKNPTYAVMQRIAAALDSPINEVFIDELEVLR